MNLDTWTELINLKEELIAPGRDNRSGKAMKPTTITIHNTDNTNKGADAHAHSRFVRNTGYYMHNGKQRWVSWHYTVDDRVAIRQLPDNERAIHAGSSAGNSSSLAMEICMQQGIDQDAANQRAAQLTAALLVQHGLQLDAVVQHRHWSRKPCPSLLLNDAAWRGFLKLVHGYLEILRPSGYKSEDFVPLPEAFEFEGGMCWEDDEP